MEFTFLHCCWQRQSQANCRSNEFYNLADSLMAMILYHSKHLSISALISSLRGCKNFRPTSLNREWVNKLVLIGFIPNFICAYLILLLLQQSITDLPKSGGESWEAARIPNFLLIPPLRSLSSTVEMHGHGPGPAKAVEDSQKCRKDHQPNQIHQRNELAG